VTGDWAWPTTEVVERIAPSRNCIFVPPPLDRLDDAVMVNPPEEIR